MLRTYVEDNLGIELTNTQVKQFDAYYHLLVAYNKHTNLTRITSKDDADIKHFLDSLYISKLLDFNQNLTICDMGAGAGFPSIPLLILFPNIQVTIVESQVKRVDFLKQLKNTLNLSFEIVHDRAETYAVTHQMAFDVVTARALGELRLILEFGVPMLKVGGYFIAPKGSKYKEELEYATNAQKILGLKHIKNELFELPESYGFRANLVFEKIKHVKGYPRSFAVIKKKPL